jgi:hypothetical protein
MKRIARILLSSNPCLYYFFRKIYLRTCSLMFVKIKRKESKYHLDGIVMNKYFTVKASEVANVFYFCSKNQELYQLIMWLDVFKKRGTPFFVCVRTPEVYNRLTKIGIKVILVSRLERLNFIPDLGVKNVFYVNNAANNTHMVRYNELTHIQLLHGDSDKPASFNPISQMYDLIYVAGEAAINRYYNHGIYIPKNKFVIVGRPQLSKFDNFIIDKASEIHKPKLVLVCTTWKGNQESSNHSCINFVFEVIESSLKAGYSVIFRPHPISFKNKSDLAHINIIKQLFDGYEFADNQYGIISGYPNKDTEYSVYEYVMSLADIMISDLASSAHDWLYFSRPLVIMKSDGIDYHTYNESSLCASSNISFYEKGDDLKSLIDQEYADIRENGMKRRNYILGLDDDDLADSKFNETMNWLETSYDKPQSIRNFIESDKY